MKKTALLIIFITLFTCSRSQQCTKGTRFWLAFMENLDLAFNGPPRFSIIISSPVTTAGTIQLPAMGISFPFTVRADKPLKYDLPNAIWYSQGSEIKSGKGILVESDDPVSVIAFHNRAYFTEATQVLPETELGKNYTVVTTKDEKGLSPSSFVIVSASDYNLIEITPSALTMGLYPAGKPFTVMLNKGETYQVQAYEDLSGSRIRSEDNMKMAVFAGARQAYVKSSSCATVAADNHLYEQLMPDEMLDKVYLLLPLVGQGSEPVSIVATQPGTKVTLNDQVYMLNGNSAKFEISEPTLVKSDGKIAVAFFSTSGACNVPQSGDPNMFIARPVGCWSKSETFYSPDTGVSSQVVFTKNYVNIVALTTWVNTIKLDGNPIGAWFTKLASDNTYSFAQLSVAGGAYHTLQSDFGFAATVYGMGNFDSYSYASGYDVSPNQIPRQDNEAIREFNVILFPNFVPEDDLQLAFSMPDTGNYLARYFIYDTRGREVGGGASMVSAGIPVIRIPIWNLASATYFMRIEIGDRTFIRRFTIFH